MLTVIQVALLSLTSHSLSDLESIVVRRGGIEYDNHYNYIKTNYSTLTDNLSGVINGGHGKFLKHEGTQGTGMSLQ